MMNFIIRKAQLLNPSLLTFFFSLLLSVIALQFEVTIGHDAAVYLNAAKAFHENGLQAAFAAFDWPWFFILLGWLHGVSGLPLESLGYFFCVLLLAGSCALLVAIVTKQVPGSAIWAFLVVLTLPALNIQRGEIMREPGFWFFGMLVFWLALRWQEEQGGWGRALLMQVAVLCAALFRLEAIILLPALIIWQFLYLRQNGGKLRLCQLLLLPTLVMGFSIFGFFNSINVLLSRVERYFYLINPKILFSNFFDFSQKFIEIMPTKFSAGDSGKILLSGFLFVHFWKFSKLLGPFFVPFLFRNSWYSLRDYWKNFQPMVITFGLYFLVLVIFFLKSLFVYGRYVSFLNILIMPLIVLALMNLASRFPRGIKFLVAAAVITMFANVISLSAKKTHYIEAGRWLAENIKYSDTDHYFDDGRIAWYAGWGHQHSRNKLSRQEALSDMQAQRFRYYTLEARPEAPWLVQWLARHPERRILAQFANAKGATIVIIGSCADTPSAPVCQAEHQSEQ